MGGHAVNPSWIIGRHRLLACYIWCYFNRLPVCALHGAHTGGRTSHLFKTLHSQLTRMECRPTSFADPRFVVSTRLAHELLPRKPSCRCGVTTRRRSPPPRRPSLPTKRSLSEGWSGSSTCRRRSSSSRRPRRLGARASRGASLGGGMPRLLVARRSIRIAPRALAPRKSKTAKSKRPAA